MPYVYRGLDGRVPAGKDPSRGRVVAVVGLYCLYQAVRTAATGELVFIRRSGTELEGASTWLVPVAFGFGALLSTLYFVKIARLNDELNRKIDERLRRRK